MTRIKVHPLFLALILFLIAIGKWDILLSTILAVLIHEYFHYLAAKLRGYRLTHLTFMPYGAVLYCDDRILSDDELIIAAAGPISNLFVAIIILASWWLFPCIYGYSLSFFRANLAIGVFNILPAYPLDGAKIILSLAKSRQKAMKTLKILGIILSFFLMILFIISSVFYDINYTLGIASVFVFAGSMIGHKKECYVHLCNQLSYLKDYNHPLEKKHIVVTTNVTIKRILKMLKPYTIVKLEVVDNAMNTIAVIQESQLEEIFLATKLNTTILQALKKSEKIVGINKFVNIDSMHIK